MIGIAIWIYDKLTSDSSTQPSTAKPNRVLRNRDENVIDYAGLKGKKIYSGTNWFNEEKIGRIDEYGNIIKGTSFFNEEKAGRIDENGNIYKGTNWLNEEKQGRSAE